MAPMRPGTTGLNQPSQEREAARAQGQLSGLLSPWAGARLVVCLEAEEGKPRATAVQQSAGEAAVGGVSAQRAQGPGFDPQH